MQDPQGEREEKAEAESGKPERGAATDTNSAHRPLIYPHYLPLDCLSLKMSKPDWPKPGMRGETRAEGRGER